MSTTARRSRSGRARRKMEIEEALLNATERLMKDGSSFTELSVERLSGEAGVSRATFYIYFEDKSHLLRQLAQRIFAELSGAARRWWDVAARREPKDANSAMSAIITTYRKHQALVTAVIEMAAYDPEVAATYRAIFDEITGNVERIIAAGHTSGAIREIPARESAAALTWMVERTCHQLLGAPSADADARVATALAEMIWGGLYLSGVTGEPLDAAKHSDP